MSTPSRGYIVAGTDTGVGKTVFSAALASVLNASYWKPIQSGLTDRSDRETVRRLSGLPQDRILPEAYRLTAPLSPHASAALDGVTISARALALPPTPHPIVVECAGGLLVPLSEQVLQIDVVASWRLPVIVCARTTLGTINHSLLSLEALRRRDIPVAGMAFVGAPNDASERAICHFGTVPHLGRLPILDRLTPKALRSAFLDAIDVNALRKGIAP